SHCTGASSKTFFFGYNSPFDFFFRRNKLAVELTGQ
ncbi:MAG: hypothetical protein ACI9EK_000901, partial [Psychroserpens sp.]